MISNKDENISNHGYIGTLILRIYRQMEKNIDKPKIDQNSWKYKKKPHINIIRSIINILKLLY